MFDLHPQIDADTIPVVELELCSVRLVTTDHRFFWVLLVPRVNGVRDIIDLSLPDQHQLTDELDLVTRVVRDMAQADKMNVASLGNMVPQLHVHVIARHEGDAAWPGPIWGTEGASPMLQDGADQRSLDLAEAIGEAIEEMAKAGTA